MSFSLLVLLVTICNLLTQSSGRNYDMTYQRDTAPNNNLLTIRCEDTSNGELLQDATFFKNRLLFDLPNAIFVLNVGVRYRIRPQLEGNYSCGRSGINDQITDSSPIVAVPDGERKQSRTTMFHGEAGSTARLDCSITPGKLVDQYRVTWRNAADPNMVFYSICISHQQLSNFQLNERYTVDRHNFSLYISNASPADAAIQYQCVLHVEDPHDNTPHIFPRTENFNLSLSVSMAPRFSKIPEGQIVKAGMDVSFNCSVVSSPKFFDIRWKHGNNPVIMNTNNNRYTVVSNKRQNTEGMETVSTLTIHDVTGYDSNTVECSMLSPTAHVSEEVREEMVPKEVVLSVLDELESLQLIPTSDVWFVFIAKPKERLLDEVSFRIIYINSEDGSESPITSLDTYFNTTPIKHIESTLPKYNNFRVKMALMHRDKQGPFFETNTVYSKGCKGCSHVVVTALGVALGAVILIVGAITIIAFITLVKRKNPQHKLDRPDDIKCET